MLIPSNNNLPLTLPLTGLVGKTPLAGRTVYEANVVNSVTTVSYIEVDAYANAATLSTVTQVFTSEDTFLHPTGSWGPFDTDNGAI